MVNSARPTNEITGIKKPSSVLVRGFSALDIAKQTGQVPGSTSEAQFFELLRGPQGYSEFDLWKQIPGNENKTIDDYWVFLGLNEAIANGLVLDQLALDVAYLAVASAAVEDAQAALALAAAVNTSTLAPKADPTFTGLVNVSEKFALTNDITPAALTASVNDWAPAGFATCTVLRISANAPWDITGIAGGSDGRLIILENVGANNIALRHDVTSTAANRFFLGEDFMLRPNHALIVVYDATSSRWRVIRAGMLKGTVAQVIAGADDSAYVTSAALSGAGAWIAADAGEIAVNTWTPNMTLGINRSWTLTGNKTLGSPSGMIDGLSYSWKFKQDATGGRTLTLPAAGIQFNFGAVGVWAPNTAANKANYLFGIYDAAESRVVVTGHVSA